MTVGILDVRPTLESGVKSCLSGARDFVPVFVFEPRTPDRRQLLCHWRRDRDGRLVGLWESALVRSGALVRRSADCAVRRSDAVFSNNECR
jgi:hypothetical protein